MWAWLRSLFNGASGVLRSRPSGAVFTVEVSDGHASTSHGEPPESFVQDVERICRLWGVTDGEVHGVRRAGRFKIVVTGGIPTKHAQAFQNAWNYPL